MPIGRPRAELAQHLKAELARLGYDPSQGVLGLAVSGGGDSMAMLHLARAAGLAVRVATVDHGLRPESAAEARTVAKVAAQIGAPHDILKWHGWDGQGNLQGRARSARRELLAAWAHAQGLGAVALAHTQDDLAEGLLMRLARGAGVDGLAAMQPRFDLGGIPFLRPLLWAARGDLRAYLGHIGADWVDDPSNEATRFDRVRMRKALPELEKLGLGAQVLADVAQHLAQARAALDVATDDLARAVLTQNAGIITLAPAFAVAPAELQRRLIQRVILWIAPAAYAPRGTAIAGMIQRVLSGKNAQLAGCHVLPHRGNFLAFREGARTAPPCDAQQVWDGVWRAPIDAPAGTILRALGADGLAQWTGWRALGLPRAALLPLPSLWSGPDLLATPLHAAATLGPFPSGQFSRHPAADTLICTPPAGFAVS